MASNPAATPATTTDATMPSAPMKGAKRGASHEADNDACAICLDPMAGEGVFKGPCGHTFHVQCAEASFVVGRKRNCPLCRAPFKHAPGFPLLRQLLGQQAHHLSRILSVAGRIGGQLRSCELGRLVRRFGSCQLGRQL